MAFNEFEAKKYQRIVDVFIQKRRPPPHVRSQLDLGYRFKDQSVEIFEIRPRWDRPQEKMEGAVAKATFVRKRGIWRVLWQRRDLKWHRYDPAPEVERLENFLVIVDRDEHACFFG